MEAKAQKTQEIEMGGHQFIIHKMTPEAGSYWAFNLLGELLASGLFTKKGDIKFDQLIEKIQNFTKMERSQFKQFQRDCLEVVQIKLPAGPTTLQDESGHIVEDVGTPILFTLTLRAFMFTVMDFFTLAESLGILKSETSENAESPSSTPL